jgi:hypothetical protein
MAKGQLRSNREKKKPKAEKNKKKSAPVPSAFERVRMIGTDASRRKFSYSGRGSKMASAALVRAEELVLKTS